MRSIFFSVGPTILVTLALTACSGSDTSDTQATSESVAASPAAAARPGESPSTAHLVASASSLKGSAGGAASAESASTTGASSDSSPDHSTPSPTLNCNLEFETFSPSWDTGPIGQFSVALSKVKSSGASASGDGFSLYAAFNASPPYNLSFDVSLYDTTTNEDVAYVVLPTPTKGGAYLFELGGRIQSRTAADFSGKQQSFDHLRGYCSLQ